MITAIHGILASSGGVAIAPSNVTAPVISGTNAVGNVLSVTTGTWNGSPAPTFAYWWKRNGVAVVPFPTPSATTYNLTNLDAGLNITCEVYATNPSGTASATSNSLYIYDADAYAYNTATTLTATTQTVALNEFILDLKGANIWTKFNALYPMITDKVTQVDIANQMKFNLKNPLDTNGAFRLNWVGGWVWSTNGATPNGTNAYADSFFNQNTVGQNVNSTHLSYYSRTNSSGNYWEIGAVNLSPDRFYTIGFNYAGITYYSNNQSVFPTTTGQIPTGLFLTSRTASNSTKLYKNGAILATDTNLPSSAINLNVWVGARNSNLVGGRVYSNRQCAFASIGSGLTDLESQLFYQIVEKYQVALSRNINPTQSFYYNRNYGNETNAYLFATQITNTTQQVAIGTFIGELKSYNIWTKMKAIYPMITDKTLQVDMANQMKYNLVNPQDSNGAYRLNFVGGWTYSNNGAKGNALNTYADTFLIPSTNLINNDFHFSIYSRTQVVENAYDMGALNLGAGLQHTMGIYTSSTTYKNIIGGSYPNFWANIVDTNTQGHQIGTRIANNNLRLHWNGSLVATNTNVYGAGLVNLSVYLGALNYSGGNFPSSKEYVFASIGDGLTDAEALNLRTAVQNLQTTLGRAILPTPPIVSDPDAQAFINSANIVDQVEATAVNNLVIGLKADGLWTSMKAIYPMVGSSASSCAVNLKTVGTYNLSFVGGWTFSQNGALPNGSNAYANTNFNPSTQSTLNNTHLSIYSRTTTANVTWQDIGNTIPPNQFAITAAYSNVAYSDSYNYNTGRISIANTDAKGFYIQSRTSASIHKFFKNGAQFGTTNTGASGGFVNLNIFLGALNDNGNPQYRSAREYAFASIGDGLTDVQATNLYTRVQAFNTALNRQV